jgi:hypothetical protein
VKVIIKAFAEPPKKVTEFVPLPAQPAHVKVPEVLNVTGSALATALPSVTTANAVTLKAIGLSIEKIEVRIYRFSRVKLEIGGR